MRTDSSNVTRRILWAAALSALFAAAGCKPTYPKCDKDEHCAEKGEVCVEGTCQQCRDDSTCPAGQACKAGRCEVKAECAADGDCKDNKVCRSGKCQTECTGAGDCGAGMKCSNNRCVDEMACATTADCPGGLPCVSGRCQKAQNISRPMGCEYPPVRFPFNEATITDDARSSLERIGECLKTQDLTVTIEGHCDERGTEEYNLALGDKRARAVQKYLERLGVSIKKLNIVSKGEAEPLDSASTEDAWAKNRRAEFEQR
ncbi:OmpA family protein [Myxococcota bacterium]|nr:OmpA family protein [Myxococcota bacterium]